MKYLLFYELAEDAIRLAQEHFPAHNDRLMQFAQRGVLLMVGTFTNPSGRWPCSPAAKLDEFMADDPFLRHGVVGAHRIREWDEILQSDGTHRAVSA